MEQGENLVGTCDSSSFALTRRLFSLLCYLRTLFELQSGCLWSSCIIPMCSLFIPYSEMEPLMSHLRELMPCLMNPEPLTIPYGYQPAVGWGGYLSPVWGWLVSSAFCVFSELLSLWHDSSHLPFLQLHFLLLLGHIQQQLHLELRSSNNEIPKTSHFCYNGSWKPWGGHFIIRS